MEDICAVGHTRLHQELDALEEEALAAEVATMPDAPLVPPNTKEDTKETDIDLPDAPTHEVATPETRVPALAS